MFQVLPGLRAALFVTATAVAASLMAGTTRADQSPFNGRDKAEEQEMLTAARKEAEERRRASSKRLEGTVNIGEPAPSEKAALARSREEELQRLSEKLRRASQLRVARPAAPAVETPWQTEVTVLPETEAERPALKPESRAALGHRNVAASQNAASRNADPEDSQVAILIVMKPGDRGIRRFDKTADPILCTTDGCYVSNGGSVPAQFISLRRSFGFANTFGPRAGACRHQVGCVFRGVDVGANNAFVQPVDLKVMVHDRRAMKAVQPDDTCKVDAGLLSCSRAIRGDDFVIWAVPERIARQAGAASLLRAVEDGLSDGTRRAGVDRRVD